MRKYIQISKNSQRVIKTVSDAKEFLESMLQNKVSMLQTEVYVFRVVYLTEEEFDKLPEFQGF